MERSLGGSLTDVHGSSGGGGVISTGGRSAADLERIKQAKKKRAQQLKNWHQYDKQMDKEQQKKARRGLTNDNPDTGQTKKSVVFADNIILLEAAARDDVDEVRKLLTESVSPNTANEDGLTALHQCCIDNSPHMCQLLLQFGANPNARDSEQWTPLHAAATCGHTQICKLLIEGGADLLAVNADGNMPYDCCECEVTLDYIENEMAKRGISQEQIDETRCIPEKTMLSDLIRYSRENRNVLVQENHQGATPLHIAAACGYIDVAQYLIKERVPLTTTDKDGWQAIHIAACWGHPEIIQLLVAAGADIDAVTRNRETIFDICEDEELHERLIQIKREAEQHKIMPKTGLVRRKSSSNPRSPDAHVLGSLTRTASIRRSSMREKSLMSWKEAKMEAEMRSKAQERLVPEESEEAKLANTNGTASTTIAPNQPVPATRTLSPNQVIINVSDNDLPNTPRTAVQPTNATQRPNSQRASNSPSRNVNATLPSPVSPNGQQQSPANRVQINNRFSQPSKSQSSNGGPVQNAQFRQDLQLSLQRPPSQNVEPNRQSLPPQQQQQQQQLIPAGKTAAEQADKSGKCCVVM